MVGLLKRIEKKLFVKLLEHDFLHLTKKKQKVVNKSATAAGGRGGTRGETITNHFVYHSSLWFLFTRFSFPFGKFHSGNVYAPRYAGMRSTSHICIVLCHLSKYECKDIIYYYHASSFYVVSSIARHKTSFEVSNLLPTVAINSWDNQILRMSI